MYLESLHLSINLALLVGPFDKFPSREGSRTLVDTDQEHLEVVVNGQQSMNNVL